MTTESEWLRRQAEAPLPVRRIHEAAARRRGEKQAEHERAELAARAAAAADLAEFERALHAVLESEGGEWLSQYRVMPSDPGWSGLGFAPFTARAVLWVAVYDLRPIGHHRISVAIRKWPTDAAGGPKWCPATDAFQVNYPNGAATSHRTLAAAVERAAEFTEAVPF